MNEDDLRLWMSKVNTQMLELILLHGTAGELQWYTRLMTEEVQRRRAAQDQADGLRARLEGEGKHGNR